VNLAGHLTQKTVQLQRLLYSDNVLLVILKNCNSKTKEDLVSLIEEGVPDLDHHVWRDVVHKHREEPVECDQGVINAAQGAHTVTRQGQHIKLYKYVHTYVQSLTIAEWTSNDTFLYGINELYTLHTSQPS